MREIDKAKPALVTGGTGNVASWIIKMLLEKGTTVNATVRDLANSQKVEHLEALAGHAGQAKEGICHSFPPYKSGYFGI